MSFNDWFSGNWLWALTVFLWIGSSLWGLAWFSILGVDIICTTSLYLWVWGTRISNFVEGNYMWFEFWSAIASVFPKHCMSATGWLWGVHWAIIEESIEVFSTIKYKDSLAAYSTSLLTWVVNVAICPCRVEIVSIIDETCLDIGESYSCVNTLSGCCSSGSTWCPSSAFGKVCHNSRIESCLGCI